MEPKEACVRASQLALAGDLQGAIDVLDPILDEFREFGPAYTLHARVFLMAGDAAQPLLDLDAAEWANREYGTSHDLQEVAELRAITYAIRTIYGGKKEAARCREQIEALMRQRATPRSWWFLPAACSELEYRDADARAWVEKLAGYPELKPAAELYFRKNGGLTLLLSKPRNSEGLIPVHYARHYRARREGDLKAADKHRKRMAELIQPGDPWGIVDLFASGAVHVAAV